MSAAHDFAFGGINPEAAAIAQLEGSYYGGPLHFVNLLAFHAKAQYPAGHELADQGLSGLEAYMRYGAVALQHVAKRKGQLVTAGSVLQRLIGDGEPWDQIAIMQYPDAAAFLDMVGDPEYQAATVHRNAGLARTALEIIRPVALDG